METLARLIFAACGAFSTTLIGADDQRGVSHPCPYSNITIDLYLELRDASSNDMYAPLRAINCYINLLSNAESDQALLVRLLSLGKPKGAYSAQEYSMFVENLSVNKTEFLLGAMNKLNDASLSLVVRVLQDPLVTNTADIDHAMNKFRSEPRYSKVVRKYFEIENNV